MNAVRSQIGVRKEGQEETLLPVATLSNVHLHFAAIAAEVTVSSIRGHRQECCFGSVRRTTRWTCLPGTIWHRDSAPFGDRANGAQRDNVCDIQRPPGAQNGSPALGCQRARERRAELGSGHTHPVKCLIAHRSSVVTQRLVLPRPHSCAFPHTHAHTGRGTAGFGENCGRSVPGKPVRSASAPEAHRRAARRSNGGLQNNHHASKRISGSIPLCWPFELPASRCL